MRLIAIITLIALALASSAALEAREQACDEAAAAVYDGARDSDAELTEAQFCAQYSDDENCMTLKQLKCEVN